MENHYLRGVNSLSKATRKEDIPDYQASSLAMAIFFQDMNEEERAKL